MEKEIRIWFDKEGDFLEVLFERKPGFFKETEMDSIMKKIDSEGKIIGFSILKVSALRENTPISLVLKGVPTSG
jgi:hypothetical protein